MRACERPAPAFAGEKDALHPRRRRSGALRASYGDHREEKGGRVEESNQSNRAHRRRACTASAPEYACVSSPPARQPVARRSWGRRDGCGGDSGGRQDECRPPLRENTVQGRSRGGAGIGAARTGRTMPRGVAAAEVWGGGLDAFAECADIRRHLIRRVCRCIRHIARATRGCGTREKPPCGCGTLPASVVATMGPIVGATGESCRCAIWCASTSTVLALRGNGDRLGGFAPVRGGSCFCVAFASLRPSRTPLSSRDCKRRSNFSRGSVIISRAVDGAVCCTSP